MNFKKMKKNFRKDMRAISPVIATLLMIAIAVVASLVVYAWVMGYMGFTTNKTGLAIQIQSATVGGAIYVQNVGNGPVSFSSLVYVDGTGYTIANPPTNVLAGNTVQLNVPAGTFAVGTHSYVIKVTTTDGTFSQFNANFPS